MVMEEGTELKDGHVHDLLALIVEAVSSDHYVAHAPCVFGTGWPFGIMFLFSRA